MIDIKTAKIGDIWYYHALDKNHRQYIGTVIAIDTVSPASARNTELGISHDIFITINWSWVRDSWYPEATESTVGDVTYDSFDLQADGYHDWINNTVVITEKERLAIILSSL